MTQFRFLVACFLLLPAISSAQESTDARVAVDLSGGIAVLADAVSAQCGTAINGGGGVGFEGGAAVVFRPRRWLVMQADTRVVRQWPVGCALVGVQVDTAYSPGLRRDPLTTSTLRLGVETPPELPLFRATIGPGVVWGTRPIPLGVFAVAWSTRGEGKRFFIEVERAQLRVRAQEQHHDFGPSHTLVVTPIVLYPVSHSMRLGIEVPTS